MPFKDFALIMTNSSGVLLKLGINANNGWVGGFDSIASGFSVYKKIGKKPTDFFVYLSIKVCELCF